MIRRTFLHPLLLLALLLVLPAHSTPGELASRPWQVYYQFNPVDRQHQQRIAYLRSLSAGRDDVRVVEMTPEGIDLTDWPTFVTRWLDEDSSDADRLLVHDGRSGRNWSGAGAEIGTITVASGLRPAVRTDVGVTTWGKVKDLFR